METDPVADVAAPPVLLDANDAVAPNADDEIRYDDDSPEPPESPSDVEIISAELDAEPVRSAVEPAAGDELSPAVRRLVRQYDLDITGIHGTGPSGRIRVGDVIGLLGGGARSDGNNGRTPDSGATPAAERDERASGTLYRSAASERAAPAATEPNVAPATPTTTVFECDMSRVLAHRKQRNGEVELLLASYYLVACREALQAVPEIATNGDGDVRLGAILTSTEGDTQAVLVATAASSALGSVNDRLLATDRQVRALATPDVASAHLLVHHYGATGSLLATPTPLGTGHTASLGLGRVRRQITIRANDSGDESPRVAALCFVTLSFLPDRVTLPRANRFLAQLVRTLETWPD